MQDCFNGLTCASCGGRKEETVVPAIKMNGEGNFAGPEGEDGCRAVPEPAEKDAPRSMAARLSNGMRSLSKRFFGKQDPGGAAAEALEATTAPTAPVAVVAAEEKKEEEQQKEAAS
mmetsp:Transcript_98735/g.304286  ORF Transcript_98735/g.304286 Transcript_98735/m.304286 type:complete len:116 (+) Transcript_98735:88-435(+)